MSLRAKLLCAGLRRFAKPGYDDGGANDVVSYRAALERSVRRSPPPPRNARFERVDVNGVRAEWVSVPASRSDRVLLYLHGGLYIAGSPRTHRNMTWRIAQAAQARVLVLDYRLAPEHPYPAGVEDVLTAQRWLLARGESRIGWCGDSAGGGLMFAALRAASRVQVPHPRAAVALSPWTDLAGAGASWRYNHQRDPWLGTAALRAASKLYCGQLESDDPSVSTAYGAFEAAPPCLIHVGESEILLDDARAVAARLTESGFAAKLVVWNDVPHVWHMFAPTIPEANQAIAQIGAFLTRHLAG